MEHLSILKDLMIIFLASLTIIFLFSRLKLPSIMGFLAAGIIIGPNGLGLISNIQDIKYMAEIGVVLLLFTIGLEISLSQLVGMKRFFLLGGGLQTGLTILISAVFFACLKVPLHSAILYGMLVSLSSTAIALKLLSDRDQLETPHGKISLGILIFQDFAVVPMMLILPVLGAGDGADVSGIIIKLLIAFAVLGVMFAIAKFLMPKALFHLAKLRSREAFTIGVLALILLTAYLTDLIGLSLALGAFIAGIILSESDYSHQVNAEIIPFKDSFNSLFFVAIGMMLNYNYLMEYPGLIAGLIIGIILVKALVIVAVSAIMGYPSRVGIMAALGLSQIGEFSFVLVQAAGDYKFISPEYFNAFISASIFTMLLTPVLMQAAPRFSKKLAAGELAKSSTGGGKTGLKDHVIIAGYGINGRNIVRVLGETGIPYLVLELNPVTVKEFKKKGENIMYGDITKRDVLNEASIQSANVIVIAISDPLATRQAVKLARELNPEIYCIVRAKYVSSTDELLKTGADEVIPEEFETSLQIFSKVLEHYHIPLNIIMKQNNMIRHESYGLLRDEKGRMESLSHLDKILAEGLTETYYVEELNSNIGMTLKQLNVRALTGAAVIAIMRNGTTCANPSGAELLKSKDTLVIYGTHQAVDKAARLLDGQNRGII
jgi:CPA2 family monovalent cation:H+ antiporter-2